MAKRKKAAGYRGKRVLDIAGALVLASFFAPVAAGVAVIVWRQGGGPVLYHQRRVGLNGDSFKVMKFRTMVRDADRVLEALLASDESARKEWVATRKLKKDPRITTIGNLLRKTSLDELPQLLNVLKGEMSLVGPRPVVYEELVHYGRFRNRYLSAKPGLTGPWQVSGRNDVSYSERVRMDVEYVREPTLKKDIRLLLKTVAVVLLRSGAY